jgi:hypothetical protein
MVYVVVVVDDDDYVDGVNCGRQRPIVDLQVIYEHG